MVWLFRRCFRIAQNRTDAGIAIKPHQFGAAVTMADRHGDKAGLEGGQKPHNEFDPVSGVESDAITGAQAGSDKS
jgi:hypothetical protein